MIATETNWAGNVAYAASNIQKPRTVEHLQEIVTSSRHVRALGSRHSFNDIADSPGCLVSLADLEGEVAIDVDAHTVTFPAGMRYGDLSRELESGGWALANLASLPHISVAGAVATATHGSGDANQTLSAAVTALELVTADGSLLRLEDGQPDFSGAVVGIGALGIVSRLTLMIEPTFSMRQDLYTGLTWSRLLGSFEEIAGAGYSVSINVDWSRGGDCRIRVKSRTDHAADAIAGAERLPPGTKLPAGTTDCDGSMGTWAERLPHFLLAYNPSYGDELQSEYLIARRDGPAALESLHRIGSMLAPALHTTEVRTIAADDLWLSPAYERDSVGIHFTWRRHPETVAQILPHVEELLRPFAARPHWGKLFAMHGAELRSLYPRMRQFLRLRERVDPTRRFANGFSARMLGD